MKKLAYESPEAILVEVENLDVITESIPFQDTNILGDGWIDA